MYSKKVLVLICCAFLLSLAFVHAEETEISVKTIPLHKYFVTVSEPIDNGKVFKLFTMNSGLSGINTSVFSSDEYKTFNIDVKVKRNEETVFYKHFGTFSAGAPVYLELLDEDGAVSDTPFSSSTSNSSTTLVVSPALNTTNTTTSATPSNVTTSTIQNTAVIAPQVITPSSPSPNSSTAVTGLVASPLDSKSSEKSVISSLFSSVYLYIVLGIVVLLFVVYLVRNSLSSSGAPSFKPINLGSSSFSSGRSLDQKLQVAEQKEVQVKAEVESLREMKVDQLRTHIAQEKKELKSFRQKRSIKIEPIKHKDSKWKGMKI